MQANTVLWRITENYLTKLAVNSNLWKIDFRVLHDRSIVWVLSLYAKTHDML